MNSDTIKEALTKIANMDWDFDSELSMKRAFKKIAKIIHDTERDK